MRSNNYCLKVLFLIYIYVVTLLTRIEAETDLISNTVALWDSRPPIFKRMLTIALFYTNVNYIPLCGDVQSKETEVNPRSILYIGCNKALVA